jgi:hypothetical protein
VFDPTVPLFSVQPLTKLGHPRGVDRFQNQGPPFVIQLSFSDEALCEESCWVGSVLCTLSTFCKNDFVRNARPSINLISAFCATAIADGVNVELVVHIR